MFYMRSVVSRRILDLRAVKDEVFTCGCRLSSQTVQIEQQEPTAAHHMPFKGVPGPSGFRDLPFIGLASYFKPFGKHGPGDFHILIDELSKKYGDIFKIRFGKDYMVNVNHPEYAHTVFQASYAEHKRLQPEIAEVAAERTKLTKPLVVLNGQEWENRRKPAQEKMLRPAVVANYVPLIEKVTNDLIAKLRAKPKVDDLLQELLKYTTESVGMLCFNKRLGCLSSDSPVEVAVYVAILLDNMQKSIFSPIKTYMYWKTPLYKRYEEATIKLTEISLKEINEQRMYLKKLEKENKLDDFLQSEPNFMYSLLADGRLPDPEINSMINDLFGAGIDSTANTLVFLLGNLALNPDKQEKLHQEIKYVTGESETLTKEHLAQMPYLKACLKESMRKVHPTPLGSIRILETDLKVGGYNIPKNTMIVINNSIMCRDERFFPDPQKFIPERWLRSTKGEYAESKKYVFAHKPFGFGPRSCIGQRFAENEIFVAAAKIFKHFKVSMPPEVEDISSEIRIFTTPTEKVRMTFTER